MAHKRLRHEIQIDARREAIWEALTSDANFRDWCSAFMPGSFYRGDWSEGSEMKFIGTDEDGLEGGMITKITRNEPGHVLESVGVGEIDKGVENRTTSEWLGVIERYDIEGSDQPFTLVVTVDVVEAMADYFNETWPKAMARVKELAEA